MQLVDEMPFAIRFERLRCYGRHGVECREKRFGRMSRRSRNGSGSLFRFGGALQVQRLSHNAGLSPRAGNRIRRLVQFPFVHAANTRDFEADGVTRQGDAAHGQGGVLVYTVQRPFETSVAGFFYSDDQMQLAAQHAGPGTFQTTRRSRCLCPHGAREQHASEDHAGEEMPRDSRPSSVPCYFRKSHRILSAIRDFSLVVNRYCVSLEKRQIAPFSPMAQASERFSAATALRFNELFGFQCTPPSTLISSPVGPTVAMVWSSSHATPER